MTPEEKLNKAVWWILQELKAEYLATPKDEYVKFKFQKETKQIPLYINQKRALNFLLNLNAIKVIKEKYTPDVFDKHTANLIGLEPIAVSLDILKPKFDEIYKKFEDENKRNEFRLLNEKLLPYISDNELYSLWEYANAERLTGKSLVNFTDIIPLRGSDKLAVYNFLSRLKEFGIQLEKITFHTEIYKRYCKQQYLDIETYTKQQPNVEISVSISKLFKGEATFEDIVRICQPFGGLKEIESLFEFIEFTSKPSDKNIKSLNEFLDIYIQCFIEDKLLPSNLTNFYRFLRQKEIFLNQIERYVQDYGLEFTFKQNEVVSVKKGEIVSIGEDPAYLFIHTLIALEKKGFFEIKSIFIIDTDLPPEKDTDDYKIKIKASEKLLNEISKDNIKVKEIEPALPQRLILSKNKLNFYEEGDDGIIEYKDNIAQLKKGKKGYELLKLLNENKNSIFIVEDIKKFCNERIIIEKHKFKDEKDISDTIREIRCKLKVKKGEYFPIDKQKKGWQIGWKWIEK